MQVVTQVYTTMDILELLCLCLLVIFSSTANASFTVNTSGYEDCIFHLVDADSGLYKPTSDFIDRTLASNQLFAQQWTITVLLLPVKLNKELRSTHDFKEVCSIMIVIELKMCYDFDLLLFGSRTYNTRNSLFFLYSQMCQRRDPDLRYSRPIMASIYYLYFARPDFMHVYFADFLCSTCRTLNNRHSAVNMSNNNIHLYELKQFAHSHEMKYILPLIAVTGYGTHDTDLPGVKEFDFLYKHRSVTEPERIGRVESHILMENIAAMFNFSIMWIPRTVALQHRYLLYSTTEKHYVASVVLDLLHWYAGRPKSPPEHWFQQYLQSSPNNLFVYCMNTETRETFSFMFWTVPMDIWSWVCLEISMFLWTFLLKGRGLDTFGILMRQSCCICRRKKIVFVFVFAAIVITSGYEGIISSLLSVPPGAVIFNTLKELIDNGYQIIGYAPNVLTAELEAIFKREKITSRNITQSLIPDTHVMDENEYSVMLANYNTTRSFSSDFVGKVQINIEKRFSNMFCHTAINTIIPSKEIHTFVGHAHLKLFKSVNLFRESGILTFYHDLIIYFQNYGFKRVLELDEFISRQPKAFALSEWKILSIFCVWTMVLVLSVLLLLLEIIISKAFPGPVIT